MNKEAVETTVMMTGIRIILGAIIAVILISLVFRFTGDEGKKEGQTTYFYFTKLIKDLNEMSFGDLKNTSFLSDKNLILLYFDKEQESIKKGDINNCISYVSSEDIKKPAKCRDKNCLCMCESGLSSIAGVSLKRMSVECESEEAECVELPLKIKPLSQCINFILYDENEKLYNLELKKEKDSFSINVK